MKVWRIGRKHSQRSSWWHKAASCHCTLNCTMISSKLRNNQWFIDHNLISSHVPTVIFEEEYEIDDIPPWLRCMRCWGPRDIPIEIIKMRAKWESIRIKQAQHNAL